MPRLAMSVALLVMIAVHADAPDAMTPGWGISVGGTVVSSGDGAIIIGFGGIPQPGKFNGTTITARLWGRTRFDRYMSRTSLPGQGVPVTIILDAKRYDDGSYRLNAIRADVR
jgi:hypothetical protein